MEQYSHSVSPTTLPTITTRFCNAFYLQRQRQRRRSPVRPHSTAAHASANIGAYARLSSAAQDALKSFLAERDEQEKRFASLTEEGADESKIIKITDFEEDWQQSQVRGQATLRAEFTGADWVGIVLV